MERERHRPQAKPCVRFADSVIKQSIAMRGTLFATRIHIGRPRPTRGTQGGLSPLALPRVHAGRQAGEI